MSQFCFFSYLISKLLFVLFLKQPIVDGRLGPSPKDKVLYVSSFNCQESNSKGQGITHVKNAHKYILLRCESCKNYIIKKIRSIHSCYLFILFIHVGRSTCQLFSSGCKPNVHIFKSQRLPSLELFE